MTINSACCAALAATPSISRRGMHRTELAFDRNDFVVSYCLCVCVCVCFGGIIKRYTCMHFLFFLFLHAQSLKAASLLKLATILFIDTPLLLSIQNIRSNVNKKHSKCFATDDRYNTIYNYTPRSCSVPATRWEVDRASESIRRFRFRRRRKYKSSAFLRDGRIQVAH